MHRADHLTVLMMDVPEVARLLHISRSFAYELVVARGELPSVRFGRRVLVRRADVMSRPDGCDVAQYQRSWLR